ncbi:MAG: AtpZ/AtpI family protein [Eubacteriales bacterium]|nr:AtpZ/AtpI family protein [Sarcina sp.]MBR2729680.1 AtpZ/AtpI family protein [Lachnospiraceae bacterium]MDO4418451.1 AtpZ/AtpI family protein [Eubacteriales bacterium]
MKWNEILPHLTLLGQLGLSLATPVLLCLGGCYLAVTKLHAPLWVYLPGMILGLGASFMTAYKVYLSVTGKEKKPRRGENERSFNRHF